MKKILIVLIALFTISLITCKKEEITVTPVLTTLPVEAITSNSAAGKGYVPFRPKTFGLCWSISANPTIDDNHTLDSMHFSSSFFRYITGLKGGTEYHVRAFATNESGIEYGNEVSFTTEPAKLPELNTFPVSNITSSTATTGGNIINDNGAVISASGVCWSTTANPTVSDRKTTDGALTGEFISPVGGLTPLTTYYLRAYTTSDLGTNYGNEVSFTTSSVVSSLTDIDGNIYSTITIGNQVWMQQNLKTIRYSNGDLIGTTTPASLDISNESAPGYQWACDGKETNVPLYGRLYTWFAVTDSRNVCPEGWHVPTHTEWIALTDYLINNGFGDSGSRYKIAKSMAYTSGWFSGWIGGTTGVDQTGNNRSGFSALPAGYRVSTSVNTVSNKSGKTCSWWSATEQDTKFAWQGCALSFDSGFIENGSLDKNDGLSVRCLKN